MSLELNHSVTTSPALERRRLPPALVEDDHQVSDVGLTITVSCRDQSSTGENEDISTDLEEVKADQEMQSGDNDDDEEEEESEEEESEEEEEEEEESDSPESSSVQKNDSSRLSKKFKITVGKYNKYSSEDMKKAYNAIKFEGLSVHTASRQFGIPKSTLYDRINDRSPHNLAGGPNRLKTKILEAEMERQMVDHIKHLESIGQAPSQVEILALATKLAHSAGTIAKGKSISRSWYKAFLYRWPGLKRAPQHSSKPSKEHSVYRKPKSKPEFLVVLKSLMDKLKLHSRPHLLYKVDEVVFNLNKKSSSSLPQPQKRTVSSESTDLTATVLLCGSALGYSLPPFFVCKKKKSSSFTRGSMEGSTFKVSDSGLATTASVKDFIKDHFIPNMAKKDDEQVLLILDDPANLLTQNVAEWAAHQGIIIYTLPTQHYDQSRTLEFGSFYTFSQAFSSVCTDFLTEHKKISLCNLSHMVYLAMVKSLTMKNLKASFLQAGIYPFDKTRKELILAQSLSDLGKEDKGNKRRKTWETKRGRKKAKVS